VRLRAGERVLAPRRPSSPAVAGHSVGLAVACLVSFWLVTRVLARVHSLSSADDELGGMWAVIATAFVYHGSYHEGRGAARSRMFATSVSFGLCLAYLLILPFHAVGSALLIGSGALVLTHIGHGDEIVTAAITTTVVMVVADISRHDAWEQPILRLADTAVGIAVGLAAASIELAVSIHPEPRRDHCRYEVHPTVRKEGES